jgi:hypothetical protein
VLPHSFGIPLSRETAVGNGSNRKLANKVAPVLLRH